MSYEWDERKRESNIEKHGIDFIDADLVFEVDGKVTLNVTRKTDNEVRYADFAEVKDQVLKLVYAMRGKIVRCISLRVASQKERRCYYEAKNEKVFQPGT